VAPPPQPFPSLVDLIKDLEEVAAKTPNRPLAQLAQRTDHLKAILDILRAGEALFALSVPLDAATVVGDAVYFDETSGTYKKALGAVETDPTTGSLILAESSFAIGLIASKATDTLGTLVTGGLCRDFSLENTISGDHTIPGPYYLSTSEPGKLTLQKPPINIFVLFNKDGDNFHLMPLIRDFVESHIHFRVELFAQPAGDHDCVAFGAGEFHQIVNPDSSKPGWLPANDPVFAGAAPVGAKFGYNLSQHEELRRIFPPIPIDSTHLERNGKGLPDQSSPRPTYTIDTNGIWWFEDCYGAAPWAPEFPGCITSSPSPSPSPSPSSSSLSSSSSPPVSPTPAVPVFDCQTPLEYLPGHGDQRLDEMTLIFYFTKMVFKTSESVVTSLAPEAGSPITVKDCDGNVATTGDLKLGLNLNLQAVTEEEAQETLSSVSGTTFKKSKVVSTIQAGTNVTISAIPGKPATFDAPNNRWQGNLRIDATLPGSQELEGGADLIALDNVQEDLIENIFVLVLPVGKDSNIRGRVHLARTLPANPQMKIIGRFMGRAAGTLPDLVHSFRRVPVPAALCTGTPLPTVETTLADLALSACGALGVNEYIEVEGEQFGVLEGDTVFFTIQRPGVDAFPADVALLRLDFKIEGQAPSSSSP
jgi:hypothetical protein